MVNNIGKVNMGSLENFVYKGHYVIIWLPLSEEFVEDEAETKQGITDEGYKIG